MKAMYSLICLFFLWSIGDSKLLNVIQINRHGARAAENYDKEKLETFFGNNMKLSQNGYRQQQILGAYIRNRYIIQNQFISSEYKPNEIRIISTPTQRTIYSADGFISGLYPGAIVKTTLYEPGLNVINNDTIPVIDLPKDYTEIPLKVMSWTENSIFNTWNCRLNGKVLKEESEDKTLYPDILEVPDSELAESAQEIASYYNKQEDLDNTDPLTFMKQINKYIIPDFYHFSKDIEKLLPKGHITVKKMYVNKWYSSRNQDSVLLKLGASELFNKILAIFKDAINVESNNSYLKPRDYYKYTVYSSHDTPIVNIIANLIDFNYIKMQIDSSITNIESYNFLVPPYASSVLFELHCDDDKKYYVKIIYNGVEFKYPLLGGISADQEGNILFDDFEKLMKNRITPEWNKVDCSEARLSERPEIFPYPSENDYRIIDNKYYRNTNE